MDRPDFVPTERVFIGDLNLATPAGLKLAQARVWRAAARVCAAQPTPMTAVQCRKESLQLAQQEIARRRIGWQRASTAKE
jgi:UrcA family protein